MTYGPEKASRDLSLVRDGLASGEARARLEHHLLTLLRDHGDEGVSSFLLSLTEHEFSLAPDPGSAMERKPACPMTIPGIARSTSCGMRSAPWPIARPRRPLPGRGRYS